jgi:hypothetical protein
MNVASYYRELASHFRVLAELTWYDDLEALLRRIAQDYDEIAEDLEAGAKEIRHPERIRDDSQYNRELASKLVVIASQCRLPAARQEIIDLATDLGKLSRPVEILGED